MLNDLSVSGTNTAAGINWSAHRAGKLFARRRHIEPSKMGNPRHPQLTSYDSAEGY